MSDDGTTLDPLEISYIARQKLGALGTASLNWKLWRGSQWESGREGEAPQHTVPVTVTLPDLSAKDRNYIF